LDLCLKYNNFLLLIFFDGRKIYFFIFFARKIAATVLKLLERLLVSGGLGDLQRVELDGLRQRPAFLLIHTFFTIN
jgi:hypothetical protein